MNFPSTRCEACHEIFQQFETVIGEQQAHDAARQREQKTLGQQLSQEPASPCAECASNRKLTLAFCHPRKRQICNICTSDQKHKDCRREQNEKSGLCFVRQFFL